MSAQPRIRAGAARHANGPSARVWAALRILRAATIGDLMAAAGTKYDVTQAYIRALAGAGYLRLLRRARGGGDARGAVWHLARNSGPLPPRIVTLDGARALHDPNTGDHHPIGPAGARHQR